MHVCMREREDREERRVKDERIEGGGEKNTIPRVTEKTGIMTFK